MTTTSADNVDLTGLVPIEEQLAEAGESTDAEPAKKARRSRKAKAEGEAPAPTGETIRCGHCGLDKAVEEYRVSAGHPRAWCNSCASEYNKDRRERLKAGEEMADKWCTNCGKVKPMEEFPPSRSKPDGRNTWCGQCVKEYRTSAYAITKQEAKDREAAATDGGAAQADESGPEVEASVVEPEAEVVA